jgi:hypothetical protein
MTKTMTIGKGLNRESISALRQEIIELYAAEAKRLEDEKFVALGALARVEALGG